MTLLANPAISGIEEEGAFAILDRAIKLKSEGKPIINLGIGQPDFNPPPHVLEAGAKASRDGPHGYTSPVGIGELREAVAARVGKRYHVEVSSDEVVIVPGGKVTIFFACMMFGGAQSEILYPDPGFPPYREAVRAAGAKSVPYPIRESERLAEGLLDHPQVAILSDEIYSDLVFDGAPFASFMEFPQLRDRLILLDGWSKTYAMTG